MRGRRGVLKAALPPAARVLLIALLAGFALDAVRLWVVRSEIQHFAQAAALAGALELDGTFAGFHRAREALDKQRERSILAATLVRQAEAEFADSPEGPWHSRPEPVCGCTYVRVRASALVPMIALGALGVRQAGAIHAAAVVARRPAGSATQDAPRASKEQVGHFTHP